MAQSEAQVAQAKAQKDSAERHISHGGRKSDACCRCLAEDDLRGSFRWNHHNLPVREGETVVIGIQNSPGSTLMTLSNMSVITAEVEMDETDIVNVQTWAARRGQHRCDSEEDFQGRL